VWEIRKDGNKGRRKGVYPYKIRKIVGGQLLVERSTLRRFAVVGTQRVILEKGGAQGGGGGGFGGKEKKGHQRTRPCELGKIRGKQTE